MLIYARGQAVIQHGETHENHIIYEDELDWEPISGSERSMGPETVYQALVEHEDLGELRWSITEYPVGAESFKETDVGKHHLIEDFDYGLEPEPEWDEFDDPSDLKGRIEGNPEYFSRITQAAMVQHLVDWFHYFYEDPANETPYNGREGGYLYIHGGPYDAETELRDNFEGAVSEETLIAATKEIQSEGIIDWAPSSNHADRLAEAEEAMAESTEDGEFDFDDLRKIAANSEIWQLGGPAELEIREQITEQIRAVRAELPEPAAHGGIGHNHPPEEFELRGDDLSIVKESLDIIEAELHAEEPDVEVVAEKASRLSKVISWVGQKLELTARGFFTAFGKTLGVAAAASLPAAFHAFPYWSTLASLLSNLEAWLHVVLRI